MNTDQPIPFGDLSLLAHGGVVVGGYLRVIAEGPLGSALQPPAGAMLVANFARKSSMHGTLDLIPPSPVQPDGWRDWRAPILSFWLNGLVPDLARRRFGSNEQHFALTIPDSPLLTVLQRYPANAADQNPWINAAISSVEGTASPCPAGLRLKMTGPIDPTEPSDRVPVLTDARLECDVLIPWTYLSAVGSELSRLNFDFKYTALGSVEQGPWQPGRSGPGALALSGYRAYFEGHLRVPGQHLDIYPDGPFLHAWITDSVMELQGAPRDLHSACPMVSVRPSRINYGPDAHCCQLGQPDRDLARILGQGREAVVELRGGGIGHVYGRTGRDFGTIGRLSPSHGASDHASPAGSMPRSGDWPGRRTRAIFREEIGNAARPRIRGKHVRSNRLSNGAAKVGCQSIDLVVDWRWN